MCPGVSANLCSMYVMCVYVSTQRCLPVSPPPPPQQQQQLISSCTPLSTVSNCSQTVLPWFFFLSMIVACIAIQLLFFLPILFLQRRLPSIRSVLGGWRKNMHQYYLHRPIQRSCRSTLPPMNLNCVPCPGKSGLFSMTIQTHRVCIDTCGL